MVDGWRWDSNKMEFVKRSRKIVNVPFREKYFITKLSSGYAVAKHDLSIDFKKFSSKGEAMKYKNEKMRKVREKYGRDI